MNAFRPAPQFRKAMIVEGRRLMVPLLKDVLALAERLEAVSPVRGRRPSLS